VSSGTLNLAQTICTVAKERVFFQKAQPCGFFCFLGFFVVNPRFCKKTQLDRFCDFYGFSVSRMPGRYSPKSNEYNL